MSAEKTIYGTPVKSAVTTGAMGRNAHLSGPRKEEAKVSAVPPFLAEHEAKITAPLLAEIEKLKAEARQTEVEIEKLIKDRDDAEDVADELTSAILGEPINWPLHDEKWREAIEASAELTRLRAECAELAQCRVAYGKSLAQMHTHLAAATEREAKMRYVLKAIARQMTYAEIERNESEEEADDADYQFSHDQFIRDARAALAQSAPAPDAPKKWCAMCGVWGNHTSGICPELHPELYAPKKETP